MICQTGLPISCLIFPQCDLHKRWFFWFGNRSFASLCFWNGPHVDSSKVYKSCLNERRATASKTFKEIGIIGFEQLQPSPHKLFSICITQGLCMLRPKFCLFPRPGQWRWRRGGRLWKKLTMMLTRGSVGRDKRSKACPVWPVPSGCAAGTRLPITIYILDPTTPFSHSCAWPHFYISNSFLTTLS